MRGSIEQRSPGTWSIRVDLGVGPDGKRKQKRATYRGTKKQAQQELTRILNELNEGSFVAPTKLTVREYLERWLKDYAHTNVAPKTYERYCEIVRLHLSPALGDTPLTKLQPLQVQGYYTHALERGRRDGKGGLSAQTVIHHHRLLRCALGHAVRWQLVARNVADAVTPPSIASAAETEAQDGANDAELHILDEAGTQKMLQAAEGTRLYVPTLLAITTGLRLGEILALRWQDVSFETQELTIRQALEQTKQGLRFKKPKTHRSKRPIALPKILVEVLRWYKGQQAEIRIAKGPEYQNYDLVVCQANGEPWRTTIISKAWGHLADQCGCPQIRFHDLRHGHCTWLLSNGVSLKVAQERMGHSRASTTLDIYGHVLPGQQEAAAEKVNAAFGGFIKSA